MAEILNNLLQTEKGLLRLKDKVGNSIKCNYEVYCGEPTGRMGSGEKTVQRYSRLYSALLKRGTGDLKGPKLKTDHDYQLRERLALKGTRFSLS